MAMTQCKECGKEISTKAAACPHCGAKAKRTSALTWFVAGLIGLAVVSSFGVQLMDPPKCPDIDPAAFWTKPGKTEDISYLLAKARRLNAAGECALEGGWGPAYQRYFIAVSPTGRPENARNLRFTREELER